MQINIRDAYEIPITYNFLLTQLIYKLYTIKIYDG